MARLYRVEPAVRGGTKLDLVTRNLVVQQQ
jgi:hypothetical protein